MDRILLCGIEFRGHHGATPEEQTVGGRYTVDIEMETGKSRAAETDHLADTVDYARIHEIVLRIGEQDRCCLLETVAERLAAEILRTPGLRSVRVRVRKHHPPLPGKVAYAAVEIERHA